MAGAIAELCCAEEGKRASYVLSLGVKSQKVVAAAIVTIDLD
jgi:hypothetical protein